MTEKLYYENAYLKSFSAIVEECSQHKDLFQIVLNRTAFYPEGGGQPADIGVLNTVNVLDVQEKDGKIIHITDRTLPVGKAVMGGVNWPHRFSLMQLHSGEHIVSGIIHKMFGLDNVGFHMGAKSVTVDFNGELTDENLSLVEMLANNAVYLNFSVRIEWPTPQELSVLNYRSKKELSGAVRIVSFPGYDVCACCGTHVARTGEIGLIRILSAQKYKGGTRVSMLCGSKAVADDREKANSVSNISALLSAKPEEVTCAVERLLAENSALKQEASALREKIFQAKAELVAAGTKDLVTFEENLSPQDLRQYCLLLSEHCGGTVAVFSGDDESGYKYALGSGHDDVRVLGKQFNQAMDGRGGGSQELIQGSVKAGRANLEQFLAEHLSTR